MGRVKIFAGVLFVVSIMLGVGGLVMNGICENNRNTIQDPDWREISEDLCHNFLYISNLITKFSSMV